MKFSLRYQSKGLVYNMFEPQVYVALWVFFKKIHFFNRRAVPADRPVILAVNHPTAFMDPLLLCCFLDPPIYNMTRGDIFRKPFFRRLLESTNMFPVFRVRDGYTDRDRNDGVFEFCFDKLDKNRVVTIYVEGEHHLDKRVRPVQKGIVRIAMSAYEKLGDKAAALQIIPVGVNYVAGDTFRDEVMVNVGTPIMVKDLYDAHPDQPAKTSTMLLRAIQSGLLETCFHLKDDDDALAEQLLQLDRSDHPQAILPIVTFDQERFLREKAIFNRLNALNSEEKNILQDQVNTYFETLQTHGLQDAALIQTNWGSLATCLFLCIGCLPFLIGYIVRLPVALVTRLVANKKKIKREFYTSILLGIGLFTCLLWYGGLMIACFLTAKPVWIALGLAAPLLGWFSEYYTEVWVKYWATRKANTHPEREKLLQMRAVFNG